jgi:hypothetical protein
MHCMLPVLACRPYCTIAAARVPSATCRFACHCIDCLTLFCPGPNPSKVDGCPSDPQQGEGIPVVRGLPRLIEEESRLLRLWEPMMSHAQRTCATGLVPHCVVAA